jgi:type I restriction enzyme, S subunit
VKAAEKLVPELRFSDFKDKFKIYKIRKIFNRISNPVAVDETELYQQIGIRSHGKGIFHKNLVTGMDLGNKRVFWIKEDTFIVNIVFAWEQAVAKTTSAENGMIASHRFPMYQSIRNVSDLCYILYFFLTPKGKHLLGLASPGGAGRNKTLGQKTFEELSLELPSVSEQQKIASFLSALDKKIEKLTRKKELLEQYKKGVMQKIFSQEIRFKDENGKDFPDWVEKRFHEIVIKYRLGGNYQNSETKTENPLIKMGNVNRGNISLSKVAYISNESEINPEDKIEYNDLFFNTRNTLALVGKVAIWKCELSKAYYNSNLMYMKFENNVFMNYRFNSYEGIKQLRRLATGTTSVAAIYTKDLLKLKFFIPTLDEQRKISIFLKTIDKKIQAVQTQLTQTQYFKRGLLQKMFV